MAITRVQKNGSASTGTLNATPPAWGTTPIPGNLLIIVGHEVNGTLATWPTTPAGYTAFTATPDLYATTLSPAYGLYWKRAGVGETTPGAYGETSGTQDWVTYTYEFATPTGIDTSNIPAQSGRSAQSNTAATAKSSAISGALAAGAGNELLIAILGTNADAGAVTNFSGFGRAHSGFTDNPATSNGKLNVAWGESIGSGVGFTASAAWTNSVICGVRIATFKTGMGGQPFQTMGASSGGFPSQAISAGC